MFHLVEYWVIDLNIVSVVSVRSSADWLSSGQFTWSNALTTLAEPLRGNDLECTEESPDTFVREEEHYSMESL